MKRVTIDLAGPFEGIVAKLCSIPSTNKLNGRKETVASELSCDVAEVLQSIYEAARGREVAMQIGLISITPPIVPFLKDAPFYVETQTDFLLQVLARLCTSPAPRANIPPHAIARDDSKAEFQTSRSSLRRATELSAVSRPRM